MNPKARWASPALAVPKPGTEKFRFTVDLRAPNRETVPIASAMPDLENMYRSLAGSKCYAKFDMNHAYWQIELDKHSREFMSIQTPIGVYTPTRMLQGCTDAVNHFQSVSSHLFQAISDALLQWLDDFLLHAKEEEDLLERIRKFFEICREYNLKLHAEKMDLFLTAARFCGRVVDSEGIRYDPRGFESLKNTKTPEKANGLQQFLCACNCMRTSIPDYSRTIASLHKLMEDCYAKAGKRTKKSVRNISLAGLWGAEHTSAFEQIKSHLVHALKLSHPKEGYEMCLFSDASDTHWGSVLTQVPKSQLSMEIEEQVHEPLSFLSGSFSGHSKNWSIVESVCSCGVDDKIGISNLHQRSICIHRSLEPAVHFLSVWTKPWYKQASSKQADMVGIEAKCLPICY